MTIASDAQDQINAVIAAGLSEDDMAPMQRAVDALKKYEGIGTPDAFLKMARRSDILAEYVSGLPDPVQKAWFQVLEERRAL